MLRHFGCLHALNDSLAHQWHLRNRSLSSIRPFNEELIDANNGTRHLADTHIAFTRNIDPDTITQADNIASVLT